MAAAPDAPVLDIFDNPDFPELSNFVEGYGFWTEGETHSRRLWWPSAEHYFQAGKFADPAQQAAVRSARTAGEAKHMGRKLNPLRPDWDEIKRSRIHRAMLEKFWTHDACREKLLGIPDGVQLVNGNPVDNFFGTGGDGEGQNVIGEVLMELRALFKAYPCRLKFPVSVCGCDEPFAPYSAIVDLTGQPQEATLALAAAALGVPVEMVTDVELVTEGGFEKTSVNDFDGLEAFQKFLLKNRDDTGLEVAMGETALVTVWNGFTDDYVNRAELMHLFPSAAALSQRLQVMVPMTAHADFARPITVQVDGEELGPLDDHVFSQMQRAAADGADVVVTANYDLPETVAEQSAFDRTTLEKPKAKTRTHGDAAHTSFSKAQLKDRICGLFWGAALGDAVGLSTEFMKPEKAAEAYPNGASQLGPASRVEDRHRSRWAQGDWTDDTDQLILLADAVVKGQGIVDPAVFASSLKCWRQQGFPELGDSSGLGIGETVNGVLEHMAFNLAPTVASEAIWRESGCTAAANGAVMRCAGAAFSYFWDEEAVAHNAAIAAKATHFDPRCVASCVGVAHLISRALQGVQLDDFDRRQGEVATAYHNALGHLEGQNSDELWQFMNVGTGIDGLRSLKLGIGGIGYTYKPVGAACWAFLHADDFKSAISAITMEAGDADSNATVAGALLGARLGFSALPQDWLEAIPKTQASWMAAKIGTYLQLLGLPAAE